MRSGRAVRPTACGARCATSGRLRTRGGRVSLRVSQGIHSGTLHLFLVGGLAPRAHAGRAGASTVVRMEKAADAGEILISAGHRRAAPRAAAQEPRRGRDCCSRRARARSRAWVEPAFTRPALDDVAQCLPTMVRAHVFEGGQPVGTPQRDRRVPAVRRHRCADRAGGRLMRPPKRWMSSWRCPGSRSITSRSASSKTDVDDGGGSCCSPPGRRASSATTRSERSRCGGCSRGSRRLPVSIGVNRGNVFAGDIGPSYRRPTASWGTR